MSKEFKPLHEQVAEKLAAQLKEGTSIFQKTWAPGDEAAFNIPVNPTTGKDYKGMNALWLAMQERKDPRWMTVNQASYAGYTVDKNTKATMISFRKTEDIQAVRDFKGEKMQDDNGDTITQTVKLPKPKIEVAFLINAEQIKGIKPLAEYLLEKQVEQQSSPLERAEKLIEDSKAAIEHGGIEAFYDMAKDQIKLPAGELFLNESEYYAIAIRELSHWSGHPDRLDRPMEGRIGSEAYAGEELRAEIASLMISSELKLGRPFGLNENSAFNMAKILKDDPFEIFRAAADAQRIFDYMGKLGQAQEIKKEAAPAQALSFKKGETIPYNGNEFKVTEVLKNKNVKLVDASGTRMTVKPNDGLYKSLLEAKDNPLEQQMELEEETKRQIGR